MSSYFRCFILLVSFMIIFISSTFAQYAHDDGDIWIAQSRIVDWSNVGVFEEDAIWVHHKLDVTDPAFGAIPNDGIDDSPACSLAIEEAKLRDGITLIYFPQGTYLLRSPIDLTTIKNTSGDVTFNGNIVFQGEGSDKTYLEFDFTSVSNPCFKFTGLITSQDDFVPVNSDVSKDSDQLSTDISAMANNDDWIYFQEYNSPHTTDQHNCLGQITKVVDAATGIITDKASKFYSSDNDLRVRKMWPIMNIGIENMSVKRVSGGHSWDASNLVFRQAINCWIRGIESIETSENHVKAEWSSHIEISGCYFYEAHNHEGGYGYGVTLNKSTTNCLIVNNIFKKLRHSMVVQDGANCNVFAYNHSENIKTDASWIEEDFESDITVHGDYPYANLFEGNSCVRIFLDQAHGKNGPYNTFLRNVTHGETTLHCFASDYSNFVANDNINNINDHVEPGEWFINFLTTQWGSGDLESSDNVLDVYSLDTTHDDAEVSHKLFFDNLWGFWDISYLNDYSYYYSPYPQFLDGYIQPSFGAPLKANNGTIINILIMNIPASDRDELAIKTYNANPSFYQELDIQVEQKDYQNNNVGEISRWVTGWDTTDVSTGAKTISVIHGINVLKSTKSTTVDKFHNWNNVEFTNHVNYFIDDLNLAKITVQNLKPVEASICNSVTGVLTSNLKFKDPWLIDYDDQPYGIRNQGMAAPLVPCTSPINLTLSSPFNGVFLDQGGIDINNLIPPYYSVAADETINAQAHGEQIQWYFKNWSGPDDKAEFEHPDQNETAVVFRQPDAEVQALYKGHLASGNERTTGYNNSRSLSKSPDGVLHLVYEDNNEIYYTSSTDNGSEWSKEVKISTGANNMNPSIASRDNDVYVTWGQIPSSAQHNVLYRRKHNEDWGEIENADHIALPNLGSASDPAPVIAPFC